MVFKLLVCLVVMVRQPPDPSSLSFRVPAGWHTFFQLFEAIVTSSTDPRSENLYPALKNDQGWFPDLMLPDPNIFPDREQMDRIRTWILLTINTHEMFND